MPVSLRIMLALLTGKILTALLHLFHLGGSSLPGRVALWVAPDMLRVLTQGLSDGVVLITGTNGKTSTAHILCRLLEREGKVVVSNRSGANMLGGVASAMLTGVNYRGVCKATVAVFEVDEATLPKLTTYIEPRIVLVTNLLRDQLDRLFEPQIIAKRLRLACEKLPTSTIVILNADDPISAQLGLIKHVTVQYYGIENYPVNGDRQVSDTRGCPCCGEELLYTTVHFAHLGHYNCSRCKYRRRTPDWRGTVRTGAKNTSLMIRYKQQVQNVSIVLAGTYNAYNTISAIAAACMLGIAPTASSLRIEPAWGAFGRLEEVVVAGTKLVLVLAKNPTGMQEAMKALRERYDFSTSVFVLNDNAADGRDVSWIWDVHFDLLINMLKRATVSGRRAAEMAMRLKYAGLEANRITVISPPAKALSHAIRTVHGPAVIPVFATYTGMLQLRKHLVRRGLARPFWAS